jgi:hypothetical protein
MRGNLVAARFTHETSRALDPHLHTHVVVFNATFDEQEDRWKALQNYDMLRAKKYIENVYYHELAKDLHNLGYSIRNRPRGDFHVEGVPEELCERFSKRHKQIDDALDDLLANKPGLATANLKDLRGHLAAAERSRKMRDIPYSQLRSLWDAQLSQDDRQALSSLIQPKVAETHLTDVEIAPEATTGRGSEFAVVERFSEDSPYARANGRCELLLTGSDSNRLIHDYVECERKTLRL